MMEDPNANQSEEQDHKIGFSLDRERARITIMKFMIALLFMILFLLSVISLLSNR